MVYGGKPSTGCYLCRKRKIKCDEGFPECRNCMVYGRPCPGYRTDAVFRNETKKVEQLAKKTSSPSNSSSRSQSSTLQSPVLVDRRRDNFRESPTLTFFSPADATWEQRAICFFFDQYTIYGDCEDGMGHLEYIPPLYAKSGEIDSAGRPSCLRWAVDATALMTLANTAHAPQLMVKARQGYGKALRGLRDALASPDQALKDETFASVVLLSLYEDISGERNGLYSSHTAGFEFLMKLRGQGQLNSQWGRDMFNFAWTHTYVEVLALGDKPRSNADWVLDLLDPEDPVERLMLAASKLSHLFLSMQSSPSPPDQATVASWIAAGRACDFELSQWSQHLPERWLPLMVYSAQGEPLITYHHISNCVVWNYYRAVRVMLQQLLLSLYRTLAAVTARYTPTTTPPPSPDPGLDPKLLRAVIQEMTTDTCRSIPFSLGDIDTLARPVSPASNGKLPLRAAQAYGLLWPLWYILSCGLPSPTQVDQIRSVLTRVGSTLGIKLALILAREADRIRGEQS